MLSMTKSEIRSVLENALVSVVIANHNRCDDLRQALRSVLSQDYPDVEVIVVDNASQDASRTMVRSEFPDVRLISLDDNPAMAGYSEGFRQARGEIVFQMDNDSLLPDVTVLSSVVQPFLTEAPDLAAVATRVEEYRPGVDSIADLRQSATGNGPLDTGGFHAGGVGFRRPHLDRTDYYSREVFLYGSELFLQMQLLALGYRILYYPEVLVLHKSSGTARNPQGIYYEIRNRYWFMRRFGSPRQRFRHLPPMLLHDCAYAIKQGALSQFGRAVRDGFGKLPTTLRGRVRSTNPQFTRRVDEIGRSFGLGATLRRSFGRSVL